MISTNNIEMTREQILSEINRLPKEKLSEIYSFIHNFRLNEEEEEKNSKDKSNVMSFAGAWKEMDNKIFDELHFSALPLGFLNSILVFFVILIILLIIRTSLAMINHEICVEEG